MRRAIKITGTLPTPGETKKCVEDPFLMVSATNETDGISIQVHAYSSTEELLAGVNRISSYSGLKAPYRLTIAQIDGKAIVLDRLETFNSIEADGSIVERINGYEGKNRYEIKVGDTWMAQIIEKDYIPASIKADNVVDSFALFVCQLVVGKIQAEYSDRFTEGKIQSIEIIKI